ncbi:MAG: ribonuclease HI family protein [Candidatus Liptonbacteria bacterium]|nr:ribonuclease HI family protein [Candidatus Liptonbacteria bacterium]
MEKVIVYTDGGSRGNPGEAAFGVVIRIGGVKKEYGERIGIATNNVAEYSGVVFALKKLKSLLGSKRAKETEVEVRMDSELAVRQLNGRYKIENAGIQPLFLRVWNAKIDFRSVSFAHVRRAENAGADALVNRALDNK